MTPVITFLSDLGLTDSDIGICRAVIRAVDCHGDVQHTATRAGLRGPGSGRHVRVRTPTATARLGDD